MNHSFSTNATLHILRCKEVEICTFRAAARTSAAEAVLLLTSTYRGVSKSGKEGSFDGIPLGRVCCILRLNVTKEV